MRDKDPAAGADRVKQDQQQGDTPPANVQQPGGGKGPSAQERQEDTGKTEAQDFFRQDKDPGAVPVQDEKRPSSGQPRGDEEGKTN